MAYETITYEVADRILTVTLNRPDKLNAISPELKRTLVERFHEADADPATSVVVVRAEGRSFSAGYDISPEPARQAQRLQRGHAEGADRRLRPGRPRR
jgi:enoyl-CoA hydratase/carnithine racemase